MMKFAISIPSVFLFVDVSVAYSFYKKVLNSNLGKDWKIQETDVTDALLKSI